ncbi:MAG: hypothetical protein CMD03_02980, partial [Flavobacteriales bacterium]|nr:hypothetical protein [Flavobacteriales bacterium]
MLKFTNIILILFFNLSNGKNPQENIIEIASDYIASDFNELIFVSIEKQKLYHIKSNKIIKTFIISSSKYGTGSKENSNKTPLGLHKIEEKHGENTPINGKMIGRVFYGEIAKIFNDKTQSKTDDITSRI